MPARTHASCSTPTMPVGPSYRVCSRPHRSARSGSEATAADRHRPGVRHVGEQRAEQHDRLHPQAVADLQHLARRTPRQRMFGSMPRISTTSRLGARRPAHREPGGRPLDAPGHAVDQRDRRPVDLEVVEVLRVERGQRLGVPDQLEVLHRGGRGVAGVVPPLEGARPRTGAAQHRQSVELGHAAQPTADTGAAVGRQPHAICGRPVAPAGADRPSAGRRARATTGRTASRAIACERGNSAS